jgi:xylitol oxidase
MSHFRLGFTPSSGEELQSEFLVPREHAVAAIQAMQALEDRIRPVLQVCEIRTVAADRLWMSPQYARDTIGIHFTWMPEPDEVARVLADVEAALAAFQARPHWGKVFLADAVTLAALYERLPDFIGLIERLDPRGAFCNPWLQARVLGAA